MLVSGGGRWNDSKDGTESSGSGGSSQTASSWNVDVFVDVIKELVCSFCFAINHSSVLPQTVHNYIWNYIKLIINVIDDSMFYLVLAV